MGLCLTLRKNQKIIIGNIEISISSLAPHSRTSLIISAPKEVKIELKKSTRQRDTSDSKKD